MSRRAPSHNSVAARDADWLMRRALRLAEGTRPHPNPRVGALVMSADGRLVGEAAHAGPGAPHAEVLALQLAGDAARGGTVVVTLEPCNHHGRTPPCTQTLIDAGVDTVVIGAVDPDPRVAGSGITRLEEAGLRVVAGVAADAVRAADPGYFHHRRTGRPYVTLKMAATLDGQVAAADGSSQWITSVEARRRVHRLRADSDAVLVGAGTVRADDPLLTARLVEATSAQPVPVIVAGREPLPPTSRLFARSPLVYSPHPHHELPDGADQVVLGAGDRVDLHAMMKDLGARGVVDLLVEGGPTMAAALARSGLVDRYVLHLGGALALGVGRPLFPDVFATLDDSRPVTITDVGLVGRDVEIVALPEEAG